MYLLELRDLFKSYKEKDISRTILNNITCTFPKSGMIGVIGNSGSGKTTLFNIIMGLEKMDQGKVFFCGAEIEDYEYFRMYECGIIFQSFNLIEELSLYDNLKIVRELKGERQDKNKILKILISLKLNGVVLKTKIKFLSMGQKQRVAIARILYKNPRILLADEPTGSLDEENAEMVMKIFKKVSTNKLVLIISHNQSLLEKYCDSVLKLDDGKIIQYESYSPYQIKKRRNKKKIKNQLSFYLKLKLSLKGIINRFVPTILSVIGVTFSSIILFLLLFLQTGASNYRNIKSNQRLNSNFINIKEYKKFNDEIRETSISSQTLEMLKLKFSQFKIKKDYSFFLTNFINSHLTLDNVLLKNISVIVIDFDNIPFFMHSFLSKKLNKNELIMNNLAQDIFIKQNISSNGIFKIETSFQFIKDEQVYLYDVFLQSYIGNCVIENEVYNFPKIYIDETQFQNLLINSKSHSLTLDQFMNGNCNLRVCRKDYQLSLSTQQNFTQEYQKLLNHNDHVRYNQVGNIWREGFEISQTTIQIDSMLNNIYQMMTLLISFFAFLSFFMNLSLIFFLIKMSLYQKEKLIGTLRALGVSQKDLSFIFVWEGIFVCLFSSFIGFIVSVAFLPTFDKVARSFIQESNLPILTTSHPIFIILIHIFIGLCGGITAKFSLFIMNRQTIIQNLRR